MGQCCSERDQGSIAKIVEEEKVKLGEGIKVESTPDDGKNETDQLILKTLITDLKYNATRLFSSLPCPLVSTLDSFFHL